MTGARGRAERLSLDVSVERLAEVRAFVRSTAADAGADATAVGDLVQVVDEWVTNVVVHGYRGGCGPVEVDLGRDGEAIVVRVRDRAPAFDPAQVPPYDPALPLEHRPLGGMGVHLMRELADSIEHRSRPGGGNEITMRRAARTVRNGGNG
jgi:serine/threonine-protein kinase RsbW